MKPLPASFGQAMPQVSMPDPIIYRTMGQAGIRAMIRAVYESLAKSPIAGMFPATSEALMEAADKSALFWITACGGPPLYEQQFGAPRMRARHLPFKIDEEARGHWLACWEPVLDSAHKDFGFPREAMPGFKAYLISFSSWMVNT